MYTLSVALRLRCGSAVAAAGIWQVNKKMGKANCFEPREPLVKEIVVRLSMKINICEIAGKMQAGDNIKSKILKRGKNW